MYKVENRIEILNSQFFPIPALWVNGVIVTAPEEAIEFYYELKRSSLFKNHPDYLHEIPIISLYPGKQEEKDGYFVRTEIIYK